MMRFFVFILLMLIAAPCVHSQYGLRAKYGISTFDDVRFNLTSAFETDQVLESGFGLGLDYWFRLKKRRVEFLPEVYYHASASSLNIDDFTGMSLAQWGVNGNVQFYLLDFEEDCDCPTFSKQGSGIDKGFFIHVSPGIGYDQFSMTRNSGKVNENSGLRFNVGAGLGMDIGVSDFLTVTPMYTYAVSSGPEYVFDNFPFGEKPLLTTSSSSRMHLISLRLGWRLDYTGRRRR